MKIKHNKKRNTAFVYESLIREMTAAVIKKDSDRKEKVMDILQKHFHYNSVLSYDLKNYRSLFENQDIDRETCQSILKEAKISNHAMRPEALFEAQGDLIKDINKQLGSNVFNTFVPNYKTLATIYQIFSPTTSPKSRVILENQLLDNMSSKKENSDMEYIDSITLNQFIKKFNNKYSDQFLEEQSQLLNMYITSFVDNGLELKIFLNEELARIKSLLEDSKNVDEIKNDDEMINKVDAIQEMIENFKNNTIDDESLLKILKTQELVKEIYENAS